MKRQVLSLIFIYMMFATKAQTKILEQANALYQKKEYFTALEKYEMICKKHSPYYVHAASRIAYCYWYMNQPHKSEKILNEISTHCDLNDSLKFFHAQVLKKLGRYKEAQEKISALKEKYQTNNLYSRFHASCDSAMEWIKNPAPYVVEELKKINSPYSEITPFLFKQNSLVFASNKEGMIIKKKSGMNGLPYYDLYITNPVQTDIMASELYTEARPFSSKINSVHHEVSACFNKSFDKMYFTRSRVYELNESGDDKINRLKLFCATYQNGFWSEPYKFIFNDSTCSYGHSCMSPNEDLFFFASDMKGGYGGIDLYVCIKIDSLNWTTPINLGPNINTEGDELYPYYHADSTLYFASNGHITMGGFDLFSCKEKYGEWGEVQNLKYPINSSYDDLSLFISDDKKYGFFSSNREGGAGEEDLYFFKLKD